METIPIISSRGKPVGNNTASGGFADTKQHYAILDGLRGVAALMVVAFHLFEAHAASRFEQIINHGYLAVDFFFVLSGFVIGYAYDDRWRTMSTMDFFKRRLIRLHPMIVVAMMIGAVMFYAQSSAIFPKIQDTPVWLMLVVMVIGMTLIPVGAALDIRGWGEMHPLNGPAWSLFYEYVANILYALFVRKFSKTLLALCVFVAGGALVHYCLTGPNGDVIGGWSLEPAQMRIGLTRLLYPFFAGLLLSRIVTVGRIKHAFLMSSLIIIAALAWPRIGGAADLWKNGLYDALCIVLVFPLVVYIGASGQVNTRLGARVCAFLGAISYPIYIIHYPFVYTYTAWVAAGKVSLASALPVTALTFLACITVAYLCLTFYDIPVRRWLSRR
jgi:peptidoglycan/LPS O-acetylase OafA/YrhL